MTDYFLRFSDRIEMLSVFSLLGMTIFNVDNEEILIDGTRQYILFEIGEIYNRSGWHVNLRSFDSNFDLSSLEPFQVYPSRPAYVWA